MYILIYRWNPVVILALRPTPPKYVDQTQRMIVIRNVFERLRRETIEAIDVTHSSDLSTDL